MEILLVVVAVIVAICVYLLRRALRREKIDKMEHQKKQMAAVRMLNLSWSSGYKKLRKKPGRSFGPDKGSAL